MTINDIKFKIISISYTNYKKYYYIVSETEIFSISINDGLYKVDIRNYKNDFEVYLIHPHLYKVDILYENVRTAKKALEILKSCKENFIFQ